MNDMIRLTTSIYYQYSPLSFGPLELVASFFCKAEEGCEREGKGDLQTTRSSQTD
jgi:hypothetical protein